MDSEIFLHTVKYFLHMVKINLFAVVDTKSRSSVSVVLRAGCGAGPGAAVLLSAISGHRRRAQPGSGAETGVRRVWPAPAAPPGPGPCKPAVKLAAASSAAGTTEHRGSPGRRHQRHAPPWRPAAELRSSGLRGTRRRGTEERRGGWRGGGKTRSPKEGTKKLQR